MEAPRTDARILDAALSQFGTRGFEATSLDAIAGELGVRKQTILYWFPSKDALLDAVVERTAADRANITGDLTFHGVTKPVVLDARFNGAGVNPLSKAYTIGFNATTTINRSDFGVKTYVPLIGDAVTLRISAAFEKAK